MDHSIEPDPSTEEVAAIMAAIGAEQDRRQTVTASDERRIDRWQLAARLANVGARGRIQRQPVQNAWIASARLQE